MEILEIANRIKEKGGRLYLVGGAVRDKILGRVINDEDYCVTGIDSEDFLKLFPQAKVRGKKFAVYDLENKEFALARIEEKKEKNDNSNGHKNFSVNANKYITIEQDLSRRDITINSIAQNVLTNEIIDPFGGIEDIKNKIIRATTEAFKEDPLRVYRVARFASELDFKVDINTIQMMKEIKSELNTLSVERVFKELKKALNTNKPSKFFEVLKQSNVLDIHFKEIYNLIGVEQPLDKHPEGDVFNHTMLVIDYIAAEIKKSNSENIKNKKYEILFSALVHDLGKGLTPKEEYPHHYMHDKKGIAVCKEFSDRIKVPTSWKKAGQVSCKEHMLGGNYAQMTLRKQVSFLERVDKTILGLDGLQLIVYADKLSRVSIEQRMQEKWKTKKGEMNFLVIGKKCLNEITGKYIIEKYNISDGLQIKQKLHQERVNWMKSN